jgi:hypothetical protein
MVVEDLSVDGSTVETGAGITGSALMMAQGVSWLDGARNSREAAVMEGDVSLVVAWLACRVESKWQVVADGCRIGRCFRIGRSVWSLQAMATGSREMAGAVAGSQALADGGGRGRECRGCRGSLRVSGRG